MKKERSAKEEPPLYFHCILEIRKGKNKMVGVGQCGDTQNMQLKRPTPQSCFQKVWKKKKRKK